MKKFLTGALFALLSTVAIAATLVPVPLLNPIGSTSGQAIVSAGAGSAPGWANVAASSLASQAANTVVANATGSSAAPTAFAMPSCSTSSSILQWTSGSGFACNTGIFAAPPAIGGTTPAAGSFTTLSATGAITPSQTNGIVGTTTNNSANAGAVGEYVTQSITAVSNSTGTTLNVTSISLTAGDWDVSGWVAFNPSGTSAVNQIIAGISTVSASLSPVGSKQAIRASLTINVPQELETGTVRLSLASTTTVYLVANESFTGGTSTVDGVIRARRVR